MEDGSTKVGLIEFPLKSGAKSITLKMGDSKEKIDLEDVKKLAFKATVFSLPAEYYNMPVYNFSGKKIQKKKQMLKLVVTGTKVSLYTGTYDWSGFANSGSGFQSFSYSGATYYAIRPGEPAATLLHEDFGVNDNADFKLYAGRYFADYPELAQKIKEKVYKSGDIYQVIDDYNKH
ncbi:hypothetical protein [Flavobacterium phycosphaerae]|uniref:hypothetical protein n=1 Tax=Flavobacterium phycosphaerae TaxID=2697515 RepID=UPI001389C506|nr:hypothetical protein [Flavobacterium phycosphaerae]